MIGRALLVLSCMGMLAACGSKHMTGPDQAAEQRFTRLEHEYVVYFLKQFPVVATYLGGAEFDPSLADVDGKLRDYSVSALQIEDAALQGYRRTFAAFDPDKLSPRHRIDRQVAIAQIDFMLHEHDVRRYQERSLDTYVDEPFRGVDWQIQGMTTTGKETYGTEAEWRALIARVEAVPAYLATAQVQLANGVKSGNTPDWRLLMQSGLQSTQADAEYFAKTLPGIAEHDVTGSERHRLVTAVREAGSRADKAYRELREYLAATFFDDIRKTDVTALKPAYRADRYAFGATEYDWALHNNLRVDKTAAQLYEESWPAVQATRKSMIDLADAIADRHGWKKASNGDETVRLVLQHLSEHAPKTDEEMLQAYRDTGARLVEYARKTGLFAVPDDYKLDVMFTPPPLRAGLDGAAYYPAPPFKKTGIGRFYVTPTGNNLEQLRLQDNYAALADLAAHEGFPGHDWHYKVMSKYAEEISPVRWLTPGAVEDSSSMWEDSMAAEGWALYAEALLAEPQPGAPHGFYTPEEHLYQLQGQLYRDLRVRIDTGLHTGRLGFDDAVTLFSEIVDFQPGSCQGASVVHDSAKAASCDAALAAINRYARWPTQAITYRLGKQQILALRTRAQRELGAKFSLQDFHLQFMKQGTIPPGYFGDELIETLKRLSTQ